MFTTRNTCAAAPPPRRRRRCRVTPKFDSVDCRVTDFMFMCESTTSTFNKEKAVERSSANIVETMHMDATDAALLWHGGRDISDWELDTAPSVQWAKSRSASARLCWPLLTGLCWAWARPDNNNNHTPYQLYPPSSILHLTSILHNNSSDSSPCSIRHFHAATTKRTKRVKIRAVNEPSRSFTVPREVPY